MGPVGYGSGVSAPLLDLVIVSYATQALLLALLDDLAQAKEQLALRVVVVDNASPDGSAEAIAQAHPWVRLVANLHNLGFAKAVNQGLAMCDAPQVLLLNPDARVGLEALRALMAYQKANPQVGVVGPQLLGEDGKAQVAALRDLLPFDLYAELARFPRGFQPHAKRAWRRIVPVQGPEPLVVDAVMGAALLISRACLNAVPRFDERFFLYAEELDYCRQVRAAGFEVHHLPAVSVHHRGSASADQMPTRTTAWRYASSLAYLRKHGGWPAWWAGRLALAAAGAQNRLMAKLLRQRGSLPAAEVKALSQGAWLMWRSAWHHPLPPDLAPPVGPQA